MRKRVKCKMDLSPHTGANNGKYPWKGSFSARVEKSNAFNILINNVT